MPWVALLPVAGFASFVLDGVFVGAGWTRAMLGTMVAAIAIYLALLWIDVGLGNDGLWLAFTLFFAARAIGQALVMPRLVRRDFSAS
jgi:multidrug resistance protein, MATE family